MQRAIALAQRGEGHVNPNPLVGCVIVRHGEVIGEGWHAYYGGFHAERAAVVNCLERGLSCEGAEVYVTLEPCSHHGKQPPCADLLIAQKVKKVYVGLGDPNPLVAGGGIAKLRAAGIEVEVGFESESIAEQNRAFLTRMTQQRPYILLKWAQTLDGKIATTTGHSQWISGPEARQYVHHLRHKMMSIMVGIGTVIADDPMLNCRLDGIDNPSQPIRIVVDSQLRIPMDSQLVKSAADYPLIVAHTAKASTQKAEQLKVNHAHPLCCNERQGKVDIRQLLTILASNDCPTGTPIDSILVEGGAQLHASMLQSGWADEVNAIIAPKIVGGQSAPGPVADMGIKMMNDAIEFDRINYQILGNDILIKAIIHK